MAIYHLSMKPISRAQGRSATGAAAYRAGVRIVDERTGVAHDYTRKRGVLYTELILPGGGSADRAEFWNRLERHHKRGDAVLAREIEVSLPRDLPYEARQQLALEYARELAERYGVAVDVALHAPRTITDRDLKANPDQYWEIDPYTGRRHNGNWHAHLLLSACHVQPDGTLGKKVVELDPIHCQRAKIENAADRERARWAELCNEALARHQIAERVDHRSFEAQGITDRLPGRHLGPAALGYERRTGQPSRRRLDIEAEIAERLALAKELGELEREAQALEQSIIDLSMDIARAKAEKAAAEKAAFDTIEAALRQPKPSLSRSAKPKPAKPDDAVRAEFLGCSKEDVITALRQAKEELRRLEGDFMRIDRQIREARDARSFAEEMLEDKEEELKRWRDEHWIRMAFGFDNTELIEEVRAAEKEVERLRLEEQRIEQSLAGERKALRDAAWAARERRDALHELLNELRAAERERKAREAQQDEPRIEHRSRGLEM